MVPESGVAEAVELTFTRQEAALLLESLKILTNCRKYAFHDERSDEAFQSLATLDQLARRLRSSLGPK